MTMRRTPHQRTTPRHVHLWDRLAERVILSGGLFTLVAVLGISVYLVWVAAPLFAGGKASLQTTGATADTTRPALAVIDEYHSAMLVVDRTGAARTIALDDGRTLDAADAPVGPAPTAWASTPQGNQAVMGSDDGSLTILQMSFRSHLLSEDDTTPEMAALVPGQTRTVAIVRQPDGTPDLTADTTAEQGLVTITDQGDLRLTAPWVVASGPVRAGQEASAITRLDMSLSADGRRLIAVLRADGTGSLNQASIRPSMGGGPPRTRLSARPIQWQWPAERAPPAWIFAAGDGQSVVALWPDGHAQRYAPQDPDDRRAPMVLVESENLAHAGHAITATGKLAGSRTILLGDEAGRVSTVTIVDSQVQHTPDGKSFRLGRSFHIGSSPVVRLTASSRGRIFAAADETGRIAVFHATSAKRLAGLTLDSEPAVLLIAPKADAVLAMDAAGRYRLWRMTPGAAEISFSTLFLPVVYEGQSSGAFVYQSSSGDEAAEIKLSLIPLIFGTLKATIWAMIFATPIAVLGAIYTSEFLAPKTKRIVKPTIELMASLPSVVLGFIAAMVVAPFVNDWLPTILLAMGLIPLAVMVAALAWDLRPQAANKPIGPGGRIVAIAIAGFIGLVAALSAAPAVEHALFRPSRADVLVQAGATTPALADQIPAWIAGKESITPYETRQLRRIGLAWRDGAVVRPTEPATPDEARALEQTIASYHLDRASLIGWLNSRSGGPWPGWLLTLMIPACGLVWIVRAVVVDRRFNAWSAGLSPTRGALAALGRFLATLGAGVLFAGALASVLSAAGLDPRDSILGPYSQRNTLIVGLIMGFAIVPIMYTISEDAMRAVPNTLRLASLGAGATQWQTAVRVVLPVAGSGIFSACMIGLGRGVGETMIVLMATGNTPEMSWNLFSGFRTLAANIAVELPEAPQGSTHYRVLFLCGLVLFVMTFAINTLAELIRQRYRRRNAGL